MSKKTVNILIKIALIIQVIAVVLEIGITAFQKILIPALHHISFESVVVLPPDLILTGLIAGAYALFCVIYNKNREERVSVLVLTIVVSLFIMLRGRVITFGTIFYSKFGNEAVGWYSFLTSLINSVYMTLGIPAAILFFISAGSYLTDKNK